jgi:hypothetical protein
MNAHTKTDLEHRLDSLDALMLWAIAGVAIGLILELVFGFLSFDIPHAMRLIGSALVTIGVSAEFVIELRHRKWSTLLNSITDRLLEGLRKETAAANERAAKAEQAAAEANLARVKLESQLLKSIGPRTITKEQGERIASKLNAFLPDVSFVVLVIGATDPEDALERAGFAWQIADMIGRDTSVFHISSDVTPWELGDAWIRLPSSEPQWGNLARIVFGVLRDDGIRVRASTYFELPSVVFKLERSGASRIGAVTPESVSTSLGIVIGKRSQPIFRLENSA